MNFVVRWNPAVWIDLAYLWVTAPNPAAVQEARFATERLLGTDPHANGRHLSEGLWQSHVPPIVVYDEIDQAQRRVKITDVVHTA